MQECISIGLKDFNALHLHTQGLYFHIYWDFVFTFIHLINPFTNPDIFPGPNYNQSVPNPSLNQNLILTIPLSLTSDPW